MVLLRLGVAVVAVTVVSSTTILTTTTIPAAVQAAHATYKLRLMLYS